MSLSWIESPPAGYTPLRRGDGYAYIHNSVRLEARLDIGRFSYVCPGGVICGEFPVKIGQFCSIAEEFFCWTREDHQTAYVTSSPLRSLIGLDIGYPEQIEKPNGVTIGNDVWLGHQVRLMPGVTIGDGAVVGARSVVTKDLEPYGIYAGVPAKLIRKRFSDPAIEALMDIEWWNWPLEKIRLNLSFFNLLVSDIDDPAKIYDSIR